MFFTYLNTWNIAWINFMNILNFGACWKLHSRKGIWICTSSNRVCRYYFPKPSPTLHFNISFLFLSNIYSKTQNTTMQQKKRKKKKERKITEYKIVIYFYIIFTRLTIFLYLLAICTWLNYLLLPLLSIYLLRYLLSSNSFVSTF